MEISRTRLTFDEVRFDQDPDGERFAENRRGTWTEYRLKAIMTARAKRGFDLIASAPQSEPGCQKCSFAYDLDFDFKFAGFEPVACKRARNRAGGQRHGGPE
jgi:hypothetical protein